MGERKSYLKRLKINDRKFIEVIIDSHYKNKHSESVNDEIILSLVEQLNNGWFYPKAKDNDFEYYDLDYIFANGKPYKIIWCIPKIGNYIGIINTYRRPKK